MTSQDWPIEAIYPNHRNPRRNFRSDPAFPGLLASIKSQGIIQPLLINKDGMILAGHRRYAAALDLGIQRVPVRVISDNKNHALVPLIENLQRADLAVLEVADYLVQCQELGMMIPEMEEIVGISDTTIRQYLKLAQGPKEIRERVERDDITLGAAIELLNKSPEFIQDALQQPNLTRRMVQQRFQSYRGKSPRALPVRAVDVSRRCPSEIRPHLEYAIGVVREMLEASPNDDFSVRYRRWLRVLEDDLADLSADRIEQSFAGSVSAFQRQPQAAAK